MAPGNVMVGSLLIPCGALLTASVFLLLRTFCLSMKLKSHNKCKKPNLTGADEDLEILTTVPANNVDAVSTVSSLIDSHTSVHQHSVYAFISLLLNISATVFAALHIRPEPAQFFDDLGLPYSELILQCFYCFASIVYGLFVVWCYILTRTGFSENCFVSFRAKKKLVSSKDETMTTSCPNSGKILPVGFQGNVQCCWGMMVTVWVLIIST